MRCRARAGSLPLFEVTKADLVETICADGNDTAKDGKTRKVLAWQVTFVSNGLVASGRRKIPVGQRRSSRGCDCVGSLSAYCLIRACALSEQVQISQGYYTLLHRLDTYCRNGTDDTGSVISGVDVEKSDHRVGRG